MIGFGIFSLGAVMFSMANYTWNSNTVLNYFERQETKIPRKLLIPFRLKNDKEVYYVRFDLMMLIQSVISDLRVNERKKEELEIYTADSFKTVGHGFLATQFATMIGVPYFFEWKSVEQVDLKAIRHKCNYHFGSWFSDHILTLEDLKLSDE